MREAHINLTETPFCINLHQTNNFQGPRSQTNSLLTSSVTSVIGQRRHMAIARKAYELQLHISLKYITANVMDVTNGAIVTQVSTIEHALKKTFDLGRTTKHPQAATVVGEVLSRRLKLEALHHHGLVHGIHTNVDKQVQKKGVQDATANAKIVWGIINSLRDNGIRIIVNDSGIAFRLWLIRRAKAILILQIRCMIKGRVQGVFYRNWTVENANELGLKGWVRNRRDGSVEALFSGKAGAVDEMLQRCRHGPQHAMVTALHATPSDEDPGSGFQRKPTA
ncbi:Acylphosphatase [Bienertia sinuspersici]